MCNTSLLKALHLLPAIPRDPSHDTEKVVRSAVLRTCGARRAHQASAIIVLSTDTPQIEPRAEATPYTALHSGARLGCIVAHPCSHQTMPSSRVCVCECMCACACMRACLHASSVSSSSVPVCQRAVPPAGPLSTSYRSVTEPQRVSLPSCLSRRLKRVSLRCHLWLPRCLQAR